MELASLGRVLFSFLAVLGLMLFIAWAARKLRLDERLQGRVRGRGSLSMEESFHLDPKRRLVVVKHEERRYLLLLSPNRDIVLDELPATAETGNDAT